MFQIPSKTIYDKNNKIWRGREINSIFNLNTSIGQVFVHMLNLNPEKIVQISERTEQQLTGQEMKLLSIRAAQHFDKLGYSQDDVIGLVASNTHFLAPLVIGALLKGVPFNSLDPSFDKDDIMHIFKTTKPKAVFCDLALYEKVEEALNDISLPSRIYVLNGTTEEKLSVEEFFEPTGNELYYEPPKLKNGEDHIAAIVCSSGTTGLPKGVCLSHYCLLRQCEPNYTNNAVLLCFSTLYWLSGLVTLSVGTLCGGTRIITDRPFTPELMLELIEKYKVTFLLSPPSQMALAVRCADIKIRDLSSLTHYLCGGSVVPVLEYKTMQKYVKNAEIAVVYGMSETGGIATVQIKEVPRIGSVGQVALNMQIKIITENGNSLGINEMGEVCIKPPFKCLGYYGNPNSIADDEGWARTGDIGYFDEDGSLFVVDRKKDILKYKNFHYSPTEIETVIMQIPDIVEVCAFGISDVIATDLPAAAIVKKSESNLSKEYVYNYVAKKLVHFKHLRGGVYFLPSLPKTASGKIQRNKVKEMIFENNEIIEK